MYTQFNTGQRKQQPSMDRWLSFGGITTITNEPDIPWAPTNQYRDNADIEWIDTKVQDKTNMNMYKPPPTRLEQGSLPDAPALAMYTSDFNSWHMTGEKRCQTKMAPSWQTGPPQLTRCSSIAQRSPTHSSPDTGIPKLTQT